MVRSLWVRTLGALLVSTGLVWGQQPTSAPATPGPAGEIITIQEAGKPAQKCKVLRTWRTADGTLAHEVKPLDGGEVMTIVEGALVPGPGGQAEARSTRIYHWGGDGKPPAGTPRPPVQQTQYTAPAEGTPSGPVRYVPVPVSTPAAGTPVMTTPGSSPVVVTEVQEERPPLGSRVKGMASRLFHR